MLFFMVEVSQKKAALVRRVGPFLSEKAAREWARGYLKSDEDFSVTPLTPPVYKTEGGDPAYVSFCDSEPPIFHHDAIALKTYLENYTTEKKENRPRAYALNLRRWSVERVITLQNTEEKR